MKELQNDIKTGQFKSCYLLFGSEEYLKKTYTERLKTALVDEASAMMNFDQFSGKQMLEQVFAAADTLPFFADRRAVFVMDSGLFTLGKKEDGTREADTLLAYLPSLPVSTCLVFVESEVDKRSKAYKAISKQGRAVEFKPPTEQDLITWIGKRCRAEGRSIDRQTAYHLLSTVGVEMNNLSTELEKLISFADEGTEITVEDINALCSKSLETRIFDMVDAMGKQDAQMALKIYRNLLFMKEQPLKILGMITRQFRLLYQCKFLMEQGANRGTMAARMGVQDFIVGKTQGQAKNFSFSTLSAALDDCLAADIAFKTGKMSDDLAVELLLIQYSSMERR